MTQYAPLKTLGMATVGLLAANLFLTVVMIPSSIVELEVLDRIDLGTISEDEALLHDLWQVVLGLTAGTVHLAAAIAFVWWFHRAYKNLEHFGHQREHGTGWAIGGWFAPIFCYFRPYQIAREIWHGSDPESSTRDAAISHEHPPLLAAWWGLWMIGVIAGNFAFRMSLGADTPAELRSATSVDIALNALDVVTAPLAILVVRELTRRQEQRAAQLAGDPELARVFE